MEKAVLSRPWKIFALAGALVCGFLLQAGLATRHEGMTYDEGFHTYAGVRYWQCSDLGVNPEHPPLAKYVAALPLMFGHTPQPAGPCPVKDASKAAGYADSTKWLFGDGLQGQGALDTVLPKARLAMMLFPLCLALTAFLFTRRLFGDASGLAALALIAFEPTLIAHGPLVTTDSAVSAMALLTVAAFYLFHRRPSASMFLFAGLSCGLTFAVKHSGVLIVPTLLVLASFEVASRWRQRNTSAGAVILRESLTFFGVLLAGWVVLWAAYHFHFPARPAGYSLTPSLADFIGDTQAKNNRSFMLHVIPMLARWHLFPEAYLYGFVDVLSISNPGQSSFLFGHLYPHGVPQYFPSVILIKSTLGSLGLGVLSVWLAAERRFRLPLSALYLLTPAVVWLMGGMGSTLNIGYRHVLPIVAPVCILLGAAAVLLWARGGKALRVLISVLFAAHAVSSLASFPNEIAYANEAFGGVANSYKLLTDSNNDWGQATPQVATWLAAHGKGPCWFAYDGAGTPAHYGVNCEALPPNLFEPNTVTNQTNIPESATGTFIISSLSGSGIEWERPDLNPYAAFRRARPVAVIGGADVVYQGTFDLRPALAMQSIVNAIAANQAKRYEDAYPLADKAVSILPSSALAHLEKANALKGLGKVAQAHVEFATAEKIAASQPEWYFLFRPEIRRGSADTVKK